MFQTLAIACLSVATMQLGASNPKEAERPRARQEFPKALSSIKQGMFFGEGTAEKEILAILGKPDDVRTQHDPRGIRTGGTREIWCYGTNGHLTFPTLGCIYIDRRGQALLVFGGSGNPPRPGLFEEEQLRELLRLIGTAPALRGADYNPLRVIQIVNRLQALGKEKALAAIDEYLRVAPWFVDLQGLFLVLRVLFEVPEPPGYMPEIDAGQPWPQSPKNPKDIPRFPIWIADDIPLMLLDGYTIAGPPPRVQNHVDYFRKNGRLRPKPLSPTDAPLQLFDVFQKHYLELYGPRAAYGKLLIINQLLRLLDSVYRVETDVHGSKFSGQEDLHERWRRIATEFAKLDIRWDAKKNKYTFMDGSCLPDLPVPYYRREIWKLDGIPGETLVVVERLDKRHVDVKLEWSAVPGMKIPPATVRVHGTKDNSRLLTEISLAILAESAAEFELHLDAAIAHAPPNAILAERAAEYELHLELRMVELQEGEQLQLELVSGKKSTRSPVYKP